MGSSIMEGNYAYLQPATSRSQGCMGHAYCLPTDCLQDSLALSRLGYINPVVMALSNAFFPMCREEPMCRRLFDINTVGERWLAHSAYRLVPVVD
jgi:hypothetical protein